MAFLIFWANHREERRFRRRPDPLDDLRDDEVVDRYRLDRAAIQDLAREFGQSRFSNKTRRSQGLTPQLQVNHLILVALLYYATGNRMLDVGHTHGISPSTARRSLRNVTSFLNSVAPRYIAFPLDVRACNERAQGFYAMAGFPGVFGCVDGTHVVLRRPQQDEEAYVNRKNRHSINVQIISDHELRIMHVDANRAGGAHDSFVFRASTPGIALENGEAPENMWLLGDSGYACREFLMTPLPEPRTAQEARYNRAHMTTLASVERTIGILKQRFKCLSYAGGTMPFAPAYASQIVVACCALHNICRERNIPWREDVDPEQAPEAPAPPPNDAGGTQRRQQLIQNRF